jgi:purine-binding chemotaxis protein CheW
MSEMSRTAVQLRQDFDRSFAEPMYGESEAKEDFLAIRLGGEEHAIRLAEIANLLPLAALTRFPSPLAELLGVIGFRGAIVPVYDLRALLGYAVQEAPQWLVITEALPLALAFHAFDGHVRESRTSIARVAHTETEPARRHVHELLRTGEQVRPIVSMTSVLETIKSLVQQA